MNKISNNITIKFKDDNKYNKDKLNDETLKSAKNDINKIYRKILGCDKSIAKCTSLEDLKKIDIQTLSDELGMIEQNEVLINLAKIDIESINQYYRNLEIDYFNKKIELLGKEINSIANDSEQNIKDIAGGTLFSIASVFLGISLTSAIVTAVQKIDSRFIILFFLTCLLISVISIGVAAIFMRKFDEKAKVITSIIVIVSIVWGIAAYYTYSDISSNISNYSTISSDVNEPLQQEVDENNNNLIIQSKTNQNLTQDN